MGFMDRTSATRRAAPPPQGGGRDAIEKEGDRGLRPARSKSSGLVARTSIVVVAEVGRRRLVSNKLGKRAPKRAVRVE